MLELTLIHVSKWGLWCATLLLCLRFKSVTHVSLLTYRVLYLDFCPHTNYQCLNMRQLIWWKKFKAEAINIWIKPLRSAKLDKIYGRFCSSLVAIYIYIYMYIYISVLIMFVCIHDWKTAILHYFERTYQLIRINLPKLDRKTRGRLVTARQQTPKQW